MYRIQRAEPYGALETEPLTSLLDKGWVVERTLAASKRKASSPPLVSNWRVAFSDMEAKYRNVPIVCSCFGVNRTWSMATAWSPLRIAGPARYKNIAFVAPNCVSC